MTDLTSSDAPETGAAVLSHLGAIAGPVIPLLVWLARRRDDAFVAAESAKAVNWGATVLLGASLATAVRLYVPLLGFLGTLAQLAVLIVAVFFSLQACRNVREGSPASYPFYIRVVKTND